MHTSLGGKWVTPETIDYRSVAIYELEIPGGIKYIGQTVQRLNIRLCSHKKRFKNDNIKIHLIEFVPFHERNYWEIFYIALYKSFGFKLANISEGGQYSYMPWNKGKKIGKQPDWLIEKRRLALIGKKQRKRTDDEKKKQSNRMKGKLPICFGYQTQESIQKMRISKIGKGSKPILQYSISGDFLNEWPSIRAAAKFYNIFESNIQAAAKSRSRTCFGYIWKLKNNIDGTYISR